MVANATRNCSVWKCGRLALDRHRRDRWCAAGIVIFDVEPPANRGASHGPLIGWRLTALVQAHAQEIAHDSEVRRGELTDEAKSLATRLDDHPHARLLARILVAPCDLAYLEHALSVARIVAAERPPLTGHESSGTEAACTRFVLSRLARGWVKDYSVDPEMIEPGGQGVVYGATHKATQARVAFKRVRIRDDDTLARMRREIEAGYLFGEHPNVMPVLDADPEAKWFIMPLAAGTAKNYASELRASGQLRLLITAVCEALRAPHQMGWIHRDLKPENLLLLDNQWTVADWGLGRRPRGATSNPARTRTGTGYGTEGFAAPELSLDAHQAGPPADIYSLGQIIGSIVTDCYPQANIPLLPPSDPWRQVVERTTCQDPADRLQSVDELLDILTSLSLE